MSLYHAETRPDEKFVGNILHKNWKPESLSSFTTARIGKVAYDINGKKISPDYYRPLFIGKSEFKRYNTIMGDV